jgi:hypothetical protein
MGSQGGTRDGAGGGPLQRATNSVSMLAPHHRRTDPGHMACQVLRCGRPGSASTVPGGTTSWALCDGHATAIADGAPWSVHTPDSLLVGPDALYDLPRVVKSLRGRVADSVQVVDGESQALVHLDLTIGLEGTSGQDRDLQLVLPTYAARALGVGLLELADDAEADAAHQ